MRFLTDINTLSGLKARKISEPESGFFYVSVGFLMVIFIFYPGIILTIYRLPNPSGRLAVSPSAASALPAAVSSSPPRSGLLSGGRGQVEGAAACCLPAASVDCDGVGLGDSCCCCCSSSSIAASFPRKIGSYIHLVF